MNSRQWPVAGFSARSSIGARSRRFGLLCFLLLLGMSLFALPSVTLAQSCPSTITVSSGGSTEIDTYQCTGNIGTQPAAQAITTPPAHGTASVDSSDRYVTYTNKASDPATSDSFVWQDGNGNGSSNFHTVTVTISASAPTPITLSTGGPLTGTTGQAFSLQFSASGGNGGPYTYEISQGVLPAGLSDNTAGLISGTPTESGSFTITETASDGTTAGSTVVTLTINGGSISVTPGSLPNAVADQSYSTTLTASGGTGPYTFSQVPGTAPPAGILIGSSGTISGTATAVSSTNFSVKVTDSTGASTQMSYTLQVVAPTITLSPTSLPNAFQNNAYGAQTLTANGGAAPYTYAITSGSLPSGMSLSSGGVLSGTPTVSGSFPFTVQATEAHNFTGAQNYTLTVNAITVPGAPTGVTASAGMAQATVSFTPPANNGGATISGYTAISNDGHIGTCAASPCTVTGLTNGTTYTFTVTATNAVGTGAASAASNSVTPKATQTITFNNPGTQNFGTSPVLAASASSSLTVAFSSTTTGVCTIVNGNQLSFVTAGTCTIDADQAGDSTYSAAPTVPQSFTVAPVVPGAPTIGTASQGDKQVSVSFTAPAFTGGSAITSYTATSNPAGGSITCASSPCVVTGLTNGTAYTFTVTATNAAGASAPSAQSNSVTPAASQVITFNNPGPQNFASSPTLTASSTSGLTVAFASNTASVCTITTAGALTTVATGTCTITASQGGDSAYLAAAPVSQSFAIGAIAPGAPIIGTATAGDAQASVSFTPPSSTGGASITGYTAVSTPGSMVGTCANSPCTVTGLTNGTAYTFQVTATNSVGSSATSASSNAVIPKANQAITFNNPGTQNFGTSPTLTATASSGLPVTLSSSTTAVCTISGNVLATVTPGSCTITATQAGNGTYQSASQVSQTFTIAGVAPGAPSIGTATASDAQASVTFTPPSASGGSAITGYTATSSPGGVAGTCASSPCTVTGLTNGTAYTFTVTATNASGTSVASGASNSVTPKAAGAITNFAATPAQPVFKPSGTFTVSATGDGASSPVIFAIAPSSASVCSIQGATVTTLSAGTCTITANEAGDASHVAAPQVMLVVTITNPAPPVITDVSASTHYNTATTINLGSAITGIDVTAVTIAKTPAHGTATVSGQSITYTPASSFYGGTDSFTYTATNPGGTSSPATITVTVTPLAVPVAQAHAVATTVGTAVVVQAQIGATGPQPLTGVSVATQPAHGSAVATGNQITYTPAAGFIGTDTFTYAVNNDFGSSLPATITVTVTAAGSASGHTKTVLTMPGTPVSVDLASIVPGTYVSSSLLSLSPGNAGNVSLNQPTALTYTSTGNFLGLVQITAVMTSSSGTPVTVDVLVLVSKQPDPSKNADVLGVINAQTTEAEIFAQSQLNNIRGRLESLHDGGGSLFSNTLSLSMDGRPLHGNGPAATDDALWPKTGLMRPGIGASDAMGDTQASPGETGSKRIGNTLKGPQGLGVWIGGSANFGSFDSYRQAAGFDSDNMAITLGVDQRLSERGLVGLSLGYNHDNSDIANDGTHSIAQGFSTAVYGSFEPSTHTYIDGVLGGGGLNFSSRRHDDDTGSYLLGRRNGNQWYASLTSGYEYKWNSWLLSPYGRLEWSLSRLNNFAESGVVTGALSYGNEVVRTSQTILGVRAAGQVQESFGTLIPHFRFEFGHDFQGASSTTLSYAFIPSAGSWNVLTNPYSANGNSLQIGFGGDLQTLGAWLITTEYDYLAQPHSHDQMIRVGVRKQF